MNTENLQLAQEIICEGIDAAPTDCEILRVGDGLLIRHVSASRAEEDIQVKVQSQSNGDAAQVAQALDNRLDLIPDVYEGGLKVWECAVDLVNYLAKMQIDFAGKKVLELGCGAGLPGIVAFMHGANVHFQDYNEEVLRQFTMRNVLLNSQQPSRKLHKCRFFSGDWSAVDCFLQAEIQSQEQQKYDMIFTSETIYSCASHKKLHDTMKHLLKRDGTVYLAAKTYYFGVGGGTRDFEDLVKKEGEFNIELCEEYTEGVQREILQMKFTRERRAT